MKSRVKNFDELATTPNRRIALEIMGAGLEAINTTEVINSSVSLKGDILSVQGKAFDLSQFQKIKIVGFGKASGEAALALEKILGDKITQGAVIGVEEIACKRIEIFVGTHPKPSGINVPAGQKIYGIVKDSSEKDLIIVIVSGGGSALLNYPESESIQGAKLYDAFLRSGKTIAEINTVRKHLSLLKGGGLAKLAYPATVAGLIFSDIPGDNFENVASGATYKDKSTMEDARRIIRENNLGEFDLIETPKEDKYFEKVHNFVLVSNKIAMEAMVKKTQELGLEAGVLSTDLYDEVEKISERMFSAKKNDSVVLVAGEPRILVKEGEGKGGRNLHLGLEVIRTKKVDQDCVFISFASDGMDNSDVAGAMVDKNTLEKAQRLNLDADDYFNRFDSYNFFQKTGDLIITGPTGANVSDLMILLTKK